jgi:hypothetical protein
MNLKCGFDAIHTGLSPIDSGVLISTTNRGNLFCPVKSMYELKVSH